MTALLAILPDLLTPLSLVGLSFALLAYATTLGRFQAQAERIGRMRMVATPTARGVH
jgi:hypothetical protein